MLSRRVISLLALAAVVAAFGWGVIYLFKLRFAAGDVYPEYSSLRGDPLGTKVYFEGLKKTGAANARRNFKLPEQLPNGRNTALFIFGLPWTELNASESEYRQIDAFVRGGGRIVITLYPQFAPLRRFRAGATNSPSGKAAKADMELSDKWGFRLAHIEVPRTKMLSYTPVTVHAIEPQLPSPLSWHSAVVFTNVGFDWRIIYARGTDPVLIERRLGAGSIVLATDSFFVSNEALQKERQPKLLAWLAGNNREVLFDEVHLGVRQQAGIATLARHYNLHGGFIALLVLAGLFIWKNSLSFVHLTSLTSPLTPHPSHFVRGRESAAGFANLLRRSLKPSDLLQTCLDEWHKSRRLDSRVSPSKLERIRVAVESHNSTPGANTVETYNQIVSILNDKPHP